MPESGVNRALDRRAPADAYRARPKALPASSGHAQRHYRLRYDWLDDSGKMSLCRVGRKHHLVGAKHVGKRVLALADDHRITVTDLTTGEVLSTHLIEPEKTYWRNQNKEPDRWPRPQTRPCPETPEPHVPTHHRKPERGLEPLTYRLQGDCSTS